MGAVSCKNQGVSCKKPLCRRALLRHSGLSVFGCGLPHPSIAAHQGGHFFKIVQRERRRAQGLHGNAHELHGVVVCRHPVGAELSAAFAAMDDRPLAALAHPDGHRLHDTAAVGGTVAGFFVHMKAGQAVGAMVAVVAPGILRGADPSADFAGKGIVAGVGLIVTFFKGLAFIFTIYGIVLLKSCVCSSSGGVACGICQTSRSAHKSQYKVVVFQKALL